jgi:hypothetical protein
VGYIEVEGASCPRKRKGFFSSFTVELLKVYNVINIGLFTNYFIFSVGSY